MEAGRMMELDAPDFAKVAPLVEEVPFNTLFARAVLARMVRGRVLVDQVPSPTVCVIVHKYGLSLLGGSPNNDVFNHGLRGFLRNDALNHGSAKWLLSYPGAWESTLRALLGEDLAAASLFESGKTDPDPTPRKVLLTERVNFRYRGVAPRKSRELPPGFALRRIDSGLFDAISGTVVPRFFWDSAASFLDAGLGFALMAGGEVASVGFSAFVIDRRLELGVETSPRYRGRGLSVYPAHALIDHCLSHGYEPVWACRKENVASFRLALKLGFSPSTFHPYYLLPREPRNA